jgi:hypothetical protein
MMTRFAPPCVDVHGGFLALGKEAGGLDDHVDAGVAPRDVRRVAFAKDGDPLAIDLQRAVRGLDGSRQRCRAGNHVLEQVGERFAVRQIVNCHNLQIRVAERGAQETLRPIRPKPLIPTLTMMHSLSVIVCESQ